MRKYTAILFPRSLFIAVVALALISAVARAGDVIRFHTKRAGFVSLNIRRADGSIARRLIAGISFAAGDHEIPWDGKATDGTPLPPGDYAWSAVIHGGIALQLRGWVGDWGGDRGVPSAVAADDEGVYLGWSLATDNADAVVACDTQGVVRWTHHRGALSGCRGLAADAGIVYVLGGEGVDAEGGTLYKLSAKDGSPVPWAKGRTYMTVASLWGADGKGKPVAADYMAARNGRIYLSFTTGNFIAVLDAKSGAYLQTIVGAPPGAIDSTATQCESPDETGAMVDADFVVVSLQDGTLGKILIVHDPIWVAASDLTTMGPGEIITALAMIGDGAKHRKHDIFVALAPPVNQVQARPALDSAHPTYTAGSGGLRVPRGPWEPGKMHAIRAVALDSTGQLWAAEGDSVPKRVSVWTTDVPTGRLTREFFAPPDPSSPAAINPRDPSLMVAGGCEWRIDSRTGRAKCLGVITRDPVRSVRFVMDGKRLLLVLVSMESSETVLERVGDGDYRPCNDALPKTVPAKFQVIAAADGSWQLMSADGYALGTLFQSIKATSRPGMTPSPGIDWPPQPGIAGTPVLAQTSTGKTFLAAGCSRIWNLEMTGAETLRPLATGKITVHGLGN